MGPFGLPWRLASSPDTTPSVPTAWQQTLEDIQALPITFDYCPWDWDDNGSLA